MEPAERHKLRIRVKRLRYACGFFASLYSGKDAKAHKAMSACARDLQDGLGALTDIAFSRKLAVRVAGLHNEGSDSEAGAGPPAEAAEAFAAGALIGQAAAPADELLDRAIKACRALGKADLFW
jgi:CHAD domain-containing protein